MCYNARRIQYLDLFLKRCGFCRPYPFTKTLRFLALTGGFLCYNAKRHICILLIEPSAKLQRAGGFFYAIMQSVLGYYQDISVPAHVCACVLSATKNKGIDWAGGFCYTPCCIVATLSTSRLVGSPAGRVFCVLRRCRRVDKKLTKSCKTAG